MSLQGFVRTAAFLHRLSLSTKRFTYERRPAFQARSSHFQYDASCVSEL
jgi:hypothetical protein